MHSNFNDLRTEIMTAKEIIIKNKELFEQEPYKEMYNGDVNSIEKCMEEYHQDKLKLLRIGVVSNFVRQELERRVDMILNEPDGIVRETMIKNIPLDL